MLIALDLTQTDNCRLHYGLYQQLSLGVSGMSLVGTLWRSIITVAGRLAKINLLLIVLGLTDRFTERVVRQSVVYVLAVAPNTRRVPVQRELDFAA